MIKSKALSFCFVRESANCFVRESAKLHFLTGKNRLKECDILSHLLPSRRRRLQCSVCGRAILTEASPGFHGRTIAVVNLAELASMPRIAAPRGAARRAKSSRRGPGLAFRHLVDNQEFKALRAWCGNVAFIVKRGETAGHGGLASFQPDRLSLLERNFRLTHVCGRLSSLLFRLRFLTDRSASYCSLACSPRPQCVCRVKACRSP